MDNKEALDNLFSDTFERVIVSECVYKGEDFRSFSITVSDGKEDGIDFPYAEYGEKERGMDLLELLTKRKGKEFEEPVRNLLLEIKNALSFYSVELSDEDIEALISLEKPVLLLSRKKN